MSEALSPCLPAGRPAFAEAASRRQAGHSAGRQVPRKPRPWGRGQGVQYNKESTLPGSHAL